MPTMRASITISNGVIVYIVNFTLFSFAERYEKDRDCVKNRQIHEVILNFFIGLYNNIHIEIYNIRIQT
jgi:hypothetical protein